MKTSDQIAEEWSQQCGDSHYEPGSELAKVIRDAREDMRTECLLKLALPVDKIEDAIRGIENK